jgi:hypothetical protein
MKINQKIPGSLHSWANLKKCFLLVDGSHCSLAVKEEKTDENKLKDLTCLLPSRESLKNVYSSGAAA